MTPSDHAGDDAGLDIDLGMGIDVEVDIKDEADPDHAPIRTPGVEPGSDDEEPTMPYLIKFDSDVTPTAVEDVLGRLSPPDEGIILAGSGAVIVRAYREFVDFAERQDCVALVNAVHINQWEPNRHQVQADPD